MTTPTQPPQKLLDRLRDHLRTPHYSHRTEQAYVEWVQRFILFHNRGGLAAACVPEA